MRGFAVKLSNDVWYYENTIKDMLSQYVNLWKMHDARPWVFLKKYLEFSNLKIVALELKFDHQTVFLPQNAKVYFYSVKVEAFLGGNDSQKLYYGVGASDRSNDEVEITWYDGSNSQIERRKVEKESPAYIFR